MTLLVVVLLGIGVIFIGSALDNTPIRTTFGKIISGQPVDWTGAAGSLTLTNTGINPGTWTGNPSGPQLPGQQYGGGGGSSFGGGSSSTGGGYQVPPVPIPSQGSGSSTQAWQQYGVTQAHGVNGETGVDIGTPFHTPLTALASGQVVSASYGPWGGDIFVAVQQGAQTLYYNYHHLDQIMVSVGQQIGAGTLLGLSGGQLSGGSHPATSQWSSGPHTEFGIYTRPYISNQYALDPSQYYNFG